MAIQPKNSDFAVSTPVEKTRRIIQENGATVLSDRDRDIFLAMLDSDARPNEALKRAAKRYRLSAILSRP